LRLVGLIRASNVRVDEGADGIGQFPHRPEGAPADGLAGDDAEEDLSMFSQEQLVGVKCKVIRWFSG